MDHTAHALEAAHLLYSRANSTSTTSADTETRPPIYKAIGISLAIASGVFIGISFVLKKIGLLKANEKYEQAAGEGYGYLKNAFWWTGMTLMIIGEICNFVAYAFVDAILVTPLGALSVVITTILSAIFLKERLSMVGKVGCFLCIIGSVVIVMNAPAESSAATIQEMQKFVIAPGFLGYAGAVIIGCAFIALWAGPRYGKKTMLVYLSICSLIGGLSVVATQGLGAAIVAQIGGTKQYNQWFLYVLFVFVIATLLTEIIYLNKALNLFNAALVTPTYYVFFTSSTIVTSAILFRGFKGTVTSIVTVVMGFFVICAGVVLLQLSKSAKDVPDSAVFSGDLDQVRTIAEQEQPESEPKADAIRGAGVASIVRRFSVTRQKMEEDELRRLHEEKQAALESIGENEQIEWDGLRRRRTTFGTTRSRGSSTLPFPPMDSHTPIPPRTPQRTPQMHPPLGMSRFPSDSDSDHDEENARPTTGGRGSSFFGSLRGRRRSMVGPGGHTPTQTRSPMHPVALTEISIPKAEDGHPYYSNDPEHQFGLPDNLQKTAYEGAGAHDRHIMIVDADRTTLGSRGSVPPTPPPHSARRQFSFQNVFRKGQAQSQATQALAEDPIPSGSRSPRPRLGLGGRRGSNAAKGATEEERLGLVTGDSNSMPALPQYDDEDEEDDWPSILEDKMAARPRPAVRAASERDAELRAGQGRRELTPPQERATPPRERVTPPRERATPPRERATPSRERATPPRERATPSRERAASSGKDLEADLEIYEEQRRKWNDSRNRNPSDRSGGGGGGAFI